MRGTVWNTPGEILSLHAVVSGGRGVREMTTRWGNMGGGGGGEGEEVRGWT